MSDKTRDRICTLIAIGLALGVVGGCYLVMLGNAAMSP